MPSRIIRTCARATWIECYTVEEVASARCKCLHIGRRAMPAAGLNLIPDAASEPPQAPDSVTGREQRVWPPEGGRAGAARI